MKFSIDKTAFVSGLQQGINVVSAKLVMPILSNVLIEATGNEVAFITTNLDLGIRCKVKANVESEGAITLPAKKMATIIRSLPSETVHFELNNSRVRISSGSSHFEVMGLPAEDFPALPDSLEENKHSVPQGEFLRLLKNVSYAQSRDENRYILNGVYFSLENGALMIVATDGRRLSMMTKMLNEGEGAPSAGIIVPSKTIAEIERLLGQGENMWFTFNERQVVFSIAVQGNEKSGLVEDISIVSKVIDGNYPNFKQVIPQVTENRVKLDRQLTLDCIQRVALVASENKNSIKMRFADNSLELSAASAEYGEAHEKIAIQYEGNPVEIAFNPAFLCDPLRALVQDEVFFEFKDEMSPGIFRTLDSFLCVVMPLRVG
ncbi:MAG: DNA polymerase III subunit beta [Puniceicoccales bacterium]|jgi:DNA polymerase-3 subunit beta|nr:DNA polymerase III subunit beta [Puniceicoccales bacterium]